MTTAIMKLDALPSEPLARISDLRASLEALAPKANIITPIASVDSIMPMHRVSLRAVVIDSSVDGKGNGPECYKGKFCAQDERALGKVALEKIKAAAGVQTVESTRTDDASDPHYCAFRVTLAIRDFDGQWRQETKSRAVDLRDGSQDEINAKRFGILDQARSFIQQNAETKAGLRVLRSLLTLKQKYKVDELLKPFVVPKLVAALDANDPDQKAALIRMAENGERALFGVSGSQPAQEPRRIEAGTPPPPLAPAKPAALAPPPPVGEELDHDDEEDDDSLDLFDPSETREASPVFTCGCPCGDQAEVDAGRAEATTDKYGSVRCKYCTPGPDFDFGRHTDVPRGLLGLKKFPNLTADGLKAQMKARAAAPAAKR